MEHTITMKEIQAKIKNGVSTFSRKDNSPRGCSTVSASEVKIGDEIVIDNYFTTIVEDSDEFDYAGDLIAENDDLRKEIAELKNEISRLQSENEVLQNDNTNLMSECQDLEDLYSAQCGYAGDLVDDNEEFSIQNAKLTVENEELQTQLHQYQALFADIESSMTVSLYQSFWGTSGRQGVQS